MFPSPLQRFALWCLLLLSHWWRRPAGEKLVALRVWTVNTTSARRNRSRLHLGD